MEKLLIWDIDGTLIQCKDIGRKALNKVFFKLYNIKNAFDKIPMAGMIDSVILFTAYENNNITERNFGHFFNEYCYYLSEALVENKDSFAAPGIIKLMEFIKNNSNATNILATGNIEIGARIKLSRDNLNRYFKIGGFGDEPFERWQLIKNSIEKSKKYYNKNFKNENIFVIGDTPKDIEAAKKANVKSVSVATGNYTFNELSEYNPDYLVNDFSTFKVIKEIL